MENNSLQLNNEEPLTSYEKNIQGHAVEKEPTLTHKYMRPDKTEVEVRFYKNQFGGYYMSTHDSLGQGQRLQGHLESDLDVVKEYLDIWSKGLRYQEIKN